MANSPDLAAQQTGSALSRDPPTNRRLGLPKTKQLTIPLLTRTSAVEHPAKRERQRKHHTTVLAAAASLPQQIRRVPRKRALLEGQGYRRPGPDSLQRSSRGWANRRCRVRPARRLCGLVGFCPSELRRAPDARRGATGRPQGGMYVCWWARCRVLACKKSTRWALEGCCSWPV